MAITGLGGQRESVRKAKKGSCLAHCHCAQVAEGKVPERVGNIKSSILMVDLAKNVQPLGYLRRKDGVWGERWLNHCVSIK